MSEESIDEIACGAEQGGEEIGVDAAIRTGSNSDPPLMTEGFGHNSNSHSLVNELHRRRSGTQMDFSLVPGRS